MEKFALILFIFLLFSGCIRFVGKAGYWHQGVNDETPKGKQIGFDTQNIVQPDRPKGNITT